MGLLDQKDKGQGPGNRKPDEKPPKLSPGATTEQIMKQAMEDEKNIVGSDLTKMKKGEQEKKKDDLTGKTDEELGLVKFSEEDYALVDQVVFKGYAEKEYKFGAQDKFRATITTSTSNEELAMEKILMDIAENEKLSDQAFTQHMGILLLSLSLKSINGKDFPDNPALKLELLKSAFLKLLEFERDGKTEKYEEQLNNIIKIVKKRIAYIKALPTALTETLAQKRSNLEMMIKKLLDGGALKNS